MPKDMPELFRGQADVPQGTTCMADDPLDARCTVAAEMHFTKSGRRSPVVGHLDVTDTTLLRRSTIENAADRLCERLAEVDPEMLRFRSASLAMRLALARRGWQPSGAPGRRSNDLVHDRAYQPLDSLPASTTRVDAIRVLADSFRRAASHNVTYRPFAWERSGDAPIMHDLDLTNRNWLTVEVPAGEVDLERMLTITAEVAGLFQRFPLGSCRTMLRFGHDVKLTGDGHERLHLGISPLTIAAEVAVDVVRGNLDGYRSRLRLSTAIKHGLLVTTDVEPEIGLALHAAGRTLYHDLVSRSPLAARGLYRSIVHGSLFGLGAELKDRLDPVQVARTQTEVLPDTDSVRMLPSAMGATSLAALVAESLSDYWGSRRPHDISVAVVRAFDDERTRFPV